MYTIYYKIKILNVKCKMFIITLISNDYSKYNMKINILVTNTVNKERLEKYFRDENIFLKKHIPKCSMELNIKKDSSKCKYTFYKIVSFLFFMKY